MIDTATRPLAPPADWYRDRDDYGRTTHHLRNTTTWAVVTVLPRSARRPGHTHMVTLRGATPAALDVTYAGSLPAAKRQLVAKLTELVEATR